MKRRKVRGIYGLIIIIRKVLSDFQCWLSSRRLDDIIVNRTPLYNFDCARFILDSKLRNCSNLQHGVRVKHYVHVEHETTVEEIRKVAM